MRESDDLNISFSRFANVAFSDGSLLHGFDQRFLKPTIFGPKDIKRYFISKSESENYVFSTILAENREIFFPKPGKNLKEITFSEIAENYISSKGFTPQSSTLKTKPKKVLIFLFKKKNGLVISSIVTPQERRN